MRKIAILLPDLRGGGAERLHIHLAKDWVARGYHVEFVLMRKQGELLSQLPGDISVVGLNVDRIRKSIIPVASYLRRRRPDVLLAAMWPLTSAAVISSILSGRKTRLFLSDHTLLSIWGASEYKVSQAYLRTSIHFTYPWASGIIAVSKSVKEDLCLLGGLSGNQVQVIYNPTPVNTVPRREMRDDVDRLWGRGYSHRILAVGMLKPVKDHFTLLKAFAALSRFPKAKLIILGEGPLRAQLQNLIDSLGLNDRVSLPGFVKDPSPYYRSADLFVLSSRFEGFGNVLVEAMQLGVPIVSTACPGGPVEILEDGRYGRLVPVGDPFAMADAIGAALVAEPDREELIRRAGVFSINSISEQYLSYMSIDHGESTARLVAHRENEG